MADGLNFEELEQAQGPQAPATPGRAGLDFEALTSESQAQTPSPAASPAAGLDFASLAPNPNLDTEDRMTPGIYARNVWKSLASGVEPVSRFFVNEGKGATRAIGSMLGGLGTLGEMGGMLPFMPANPATFSEMKSLGSRVAQFGQVRRDPNGGWFTEDLPHAIGGALPYVASGIAGGAAAPAVLGSLDMGQTLYEDALAHGASENDARLSFLAGNAIGAAEAVPVGYMLGRINKLSGGGFYEIAKRLQGAGALKEATKGFLVGGGTEAGQEILSNWVASDLVGYDPTRTLSENAWDSFVTGGAVGSLLMGSMGVLQSSVRRDAQEQLAAARRTATQSGDPINAISGAFTPLRDVLPLREQAQQVTRELATAGAETVRQAPADFVSLENQSPSNATMDETAYSQILAPMSVDARVERAILTPEEETITVDEALNRTPVVTMKIDPYGEQIKLAEQSLRMIQSATEEKIKSMGWGTKESLVAEYERKLKALRRKTELSKIFAGHMKNYAASFMNILGDGTKVLIGDFSGREKVYGKHGPTRAGGHARGIMYMVRTQRMVNGKPETVLVVEMDLDQLATLRLGEETQRKPWYTTEETRAARQELFETLNHELGHYIISRRLQEIRQAGAASGSASNENTLVYQAVANDYQKWLVKMRKSQFAEYLENVGTPRYQPEHAASTDYASDVPKSARDYLFSFDEYFAQQMARLATQGKLAGEQVITKFFAPVLKQYQKIFESMPQFAKNEFGNFEKFIKRLSLHHQISEEIQKATAGGPKTFYDALKGLPGFNPENFAGLADELDNWNVVQEYGYNLLQIQRSNPHIEGLRNYVDITRAWAAYSRSVDARAMDTLAEWRRLGRKEIQAITDVLYEESAKKARFDGAELQKRLPNESQQKVYAQIRADFDFVLKEMEQIAIAQIEKNFPDNAELQGTQRREVEKEFAKMRSQGYFPFMRFGKWTVTVRDAEGKLVSYEAFDTRKERDTALRNWQRQSPEYKFSASVMKDSQFVVQGLPAAMLRTMKERIPNLSHEQQEAIDAALKDLAPFKGLKNQFLKRKGTQGYSLDAMRSYANYMRMAAGHLARVKYGDELMAAIAKVDGDAKTLSLLGRDATKRQQIANWMKGHNDYIMNPASEWTALRGAIFQWFLGFNIKSALVNLSQVPMITLPYLSARYGDLAAARALATANVSAVSYWKNRKVWTYAAPETQRGRIVRLLEQGKKDGWLDQSLAMELAVASSEGNIQRTVLSGAKRAWYKYSEWGAKPFAVAEKINRTVAAIATYNLEYDRTASHTTAYNAARDAVDRTQYENSRWNRPRFQRGKIGSAFVFTNYVQNTLHFMLGGDRGASRAILMLFLAAGLMGLPGAENAEDLIDFLATKAREATGAKNPKFDLRVELREALEELNINPDLLLHGFGRSSFGLAALGQMMGLPLPEFDLSGSLSMGRPLPLTGILSSAPAGNSSQVIGQAVTEAGGAGMAAFDSFLQGIWSRDPDQWKRTEKLLPTWMKNISQGTRLLSRGKETSASGDVIAEFDPNDPKDLIEALGKTLGFMPTDLSEGWERTIAEKESVQYYRMRMEGLLKQHNWAFVQEDEDAMRDVRQRIKEYNEQVPYPEMGIGTASIRDSLKTYITAREKAERGIDSQRRYIRLRKAVQSVYAPGDNTDTPSLSPP